MYRVLHQIKVLSRGSVELRHDGRLQWRLAMKFWQWRRAADICGFKNREWTPKNYIETAPVLLQKNCTKHETEIDAIRRPRKSKQATKEVLCHQSIQWKYTPPGEGRRFPRQSSVLGWRRWRKGEQRNGRSGRARWAWWTWRRLGRFDSTSLTDDLSGSANSSDSISESEGATYDENEGQQVPIEWENGTEEPLYEGSKIFKVLSFVLIVAFVLKHNLSKAAWTDL